jgi:hypothetical protein
VSSLASTSATRKLGKTDTSLLPKVYAEDCSVIRMAMLNWHSLIDHLAERRKMPFTYLGMPLGTTRTSVLDHAPLADSVEIRLNGCSGFLIMVED